MTNGPAGPLTPTTMLYSGTGPTGTTPPTPTGTTGTSPEVDAFYQSLNSLSVEAPISEIEANEAITLFSVVNLLLGSMSRRRVGNEDKVDVLGVLTLFYGLQDKSLTSKIVVDSKKLWNETQNELQSLRDELDRLGADVMFLDREAKRQFNIGLNNEVAGNVEFPRLFKRYVDIANDPLLSLNIKKEDQNQFSDKEKVGKAYDLLQELKGVVLQLVRSLSKYGTVATSRANDEWANFERRALAILTKVADARLTDDIDDKNIIAVLADLIDKPRDTVIAPYVVLARNGGRLLRLAMVVYQQTKDRLDDVDQQHLVDLFQAGDDSKTFFTAQMRAEAAVIKRYPLANWG
jgi:hypothetical protein